MDPFEQFQKAVRSQTVDQHTITKNDLLHLLDKSLEQGEPFATAFNDAVINPLARKLGNRLSVSPIQVDGTSIGEHINQTLKQSTTEPAQKISARLGKEFDVLGNAFAKQVRTVANQKNVVKIPSFISPSARRDQKITAEWQKLQRIVLQHANKAVRKTGIDLRSGIDAQSLIVPQELSFSNRRRWQELQSKLLKRAQKAADQIDLTFDKQMLIRDFLPDRGKPTRHVRNKWNKTQIAIMESILQSVKNTKPLSFDQFGLPKKTLLEKTPQVEVAGFSRDALTQLQSLIPKLEDLEVTSETKLQEEKQPKWLTRLGVLAGALGGALLGAGALALFNTGPFKGLGKIAARAGAKVITTLGKTIKTAFSGLLEKLGSLIPKQIKSVFGKAAKGAGRLLSKVGGKGILSKMLKPIQKIFTKGFLKRIPVLGLIISAGYAYSRFKSGDIIGGAIDLVSGIVSTVPVFGTAASIGLDIFNAWLDSKAGGATKAQQPKKIDLIKDLNSKMFTWLKDKVGNLPIVGPMIKISESLQKFVIGDVTGGLEALANTFGTNMPQVSSALAFAKEWLGEAKNITITNVSTVAQSTNTIIGKIGSFVKNRIEKMIPFTIGTGLQMILKGNVIEGFKIITKGISTLPVVGPAIQTFTNWLETKTPPINPTTFQPINIMDALQETLKSKVIDMFKNAPPWMQWIMKRVPGMSDVLASQPDIELDLKMKQTRGKIEDITAKIQEKHERMEQSKTKNAYVFSDAVGRQRDERQIARLQDQLAILLGEQKQPLNDFIWRPGEGARPFNSKDNVLSIKDDNLFNAILKMIEGDAKRKNTQEQAEVQSLLEQQNFRSELKKLTSAIESLVTKEQNKPSTQRPPVSYSGLTPNSETSEIRDPAYMLRARVWNYVRTGSTLL